METIAFICVLTLLFKGVVTDEPVSLMKGDSITLHTNTEIQKDDVIEWWFGDELYLLARINREANSNRIYDDVLDGRFRDRLQVNNQTGDLTITNITTRHTGLYQLYISGERIKKETFNVYVSGNKVKTEMKGDSFIQHNNVTMKPGDEKMMLKFRHNNSPVAEIIRNGKEANDTVHERFRDRLQVDDQTGDLIITNITTEDFGSYEVNITVGSHTYTIHRSFSVKGVDPQKGRLESNEEQGQSSGSRSLTTGAIVGIVVGVLVAVAAAAAAAAVGFIVHRKHSKTARESVSTKSLIENLKLQ